MGIDSKGVPGKDIVEQTRLAYENIQAVLKQFGASMDHIVDEMMCVTDMAGIHANLEAVFGAREEAYGKPPEVAQTLVEVSALVLPELKIEIKCVARLDD